MDLNCWFSHFFIDDIKSNIHVLMIIHAILTHSIFSLPLLFFFIFKFLSNGWSLLEIFFYFLKQRWSALSLWCVTMVDQNAGWNVLMAELVQYSRSSEESGKNALLKMNWFLESYVYQYLFVWFIFIHVFHSSCYRCSVKCLFTFIRIFLYTHFSALPKMLSTWL